MLRLLLPLAAGILVTPDATPLWVPLVVATCGVLLYLALSFTSSTPSRRKQFQHWWAVPIGAIAMAIGMGTAIIHSPPQLPLESIDGGTAQLHIEHIVRKDFSMNVEARVQAIDGKPVSGNPLVLITTRGCDYTMHPGQTMMTTLHLEHITNLGNPDETDYAAMMLRKGFRYRQHISLSELKVLPTPSPTWQQRLALWRWRMEQRVMATHTSPVTQQMVCAMLLGDSRVIDQDTRLQFSQAGVAHVLALSGLHVGVVAWLVWLLLFPLDYVRLRRVRLLATMCAMAGFALLTGASASVIRASLMIGAALIGEVALRRNHPINALALAAIIILLFSPNQLYGIGFQLSFVTVAALLLFSRYFATPQGNGLAGYIKSTLLTTGVATLSSMMMTAYYFHVVPLAALLANLLLLPLVPIIIVAACLLCIACLGGGELAWLNTFTDGVCWVMTRAVQLVSDFPASHLHGLFVSGATVVLYGVAVVLLACWLFARRQWLLAASGMATLAMMMSMAFTWWTSPSKGIVVFNDFSHLPVVVYHHGSAMLWIPDGDDDEEWLAEDFRQRHQAFLARRHIHELACVVHTDTAMSGYFGVRPPYAMVGNTRLLALQRKSWRHLAADSLRLNAHILLLSRTFGGSVSQAARAFNSQLVITAAALPADSIGGLSSHLHHLATDGAWVQEQ